MKLVVSDKKRFRSFVIGLFGIALCISVATFSQGATGEMQYKQRVVNVKKGDSVWSIASEACPNCDTREVVKQILQINHMSSPAIYEHQALSVPITE